MKDYKDRRFKEADESIVEDAIGSVALILFIVFLIWYVWPMLEVI